MQILWFFLGFLFPNSYEIALATVFSKYCQLNIRLKCISFSNAFEFSEVYRYQVRCLSLLFSFLNIRF